jgi:hypothetical protein
MKSATESKPFPVPCCPELTTDKACDVLDFHYRTTHRAVVENRIVPVEVLIHARFERCPGPMALGDLAYSTTLLPGEKVRLFTSDRRSQFSFDSSTSLSYRNSQTSEESYLMSSFGDMMSDLSVRDEAHSSNQSKGSAQGHAETSGAIESFFAGPSVDEQFIHEPSDLRELSQRGSRRTTVPSRERVRPAACQWAKWTIPRRRNRRTISSPHRAIHQSHKCHAITFFYRINKMQTIKFTSVH